MANMQEYAEMVGAEYRLITGKPFNRKLTAPCQKVQMIAKEFDKYVSRVDEYKQQDWNNDIAHQEINYKRGQ